MLSLLRDSPKLILIFFNFIVGVVIYQIRLHYYLNNCTLLFLIIP